MTDEQLDQELAAQTPADLWSAETAALEDELFMLRCRVRDRQGWPCFSSAEQAARWWATGEWVSARIHELEQQLAVRRIARLPVLFVEGLLS